MMPFPLTPTFSTFNTQQIVLLSFFSLFKLNPDYIYTHAQKILSVKVDLFILFYVASLFLVFNESEKQQQK